VRRPAAARPAWWGDGAGQGRLDAGQRVRGQAGREQHGAAVQRGVGHAGAEVGVAAGRVVEVAQRARQVAGGERDQRPVMPRVGDLEPLAGSGEEAFGRRQAGLRAVGRAHGQVGQCGGGERARLPEGVARLAGQRDRLAQVSLGLLVAARDVQRAAAADQDAAEFGAAGDGGDGVVERGQPGLGAARHHQRGPQRGEHVRLAVRVRGRPGQPGRPPELADRRAHVAEVAQHDRRGLMGDRRLPRARVAGQHRARRGQGGPRADTGQRYQLVGGSWMAFRIHRATKRHRAVALPFTDWMVEPRRVAGAVTTARGVIRRYQQ
jgi:hypothetical protein